MILIGLAIGLAGAFALTRLIESLLFGVKANDPATFADCQLPIADLPGVTGSKSPIGNWQLEIGNIMNVWRFDPAYTTVEFVVRNLWYNVRGRFKTLSGAIVLDDDDISRSSVSATIRADSVDTGNQKRDAHLLLRDFFDAEKFPEIIFQSTAVQRGRDRDSLDVEGQLTIRDKTVAIALAVNEMDHSRSPRGEEFVYYSATTTLDRFAFDIDYARGLIGRQLQVYINVQACKAPAGASWSV